MLALLGLLILYFLNLKRLGSQARHGALWSMVLLVYLGVWLGLFQIELRHLSPDGTYGSDARLYWEAMLNAFRWNVPPSHYPAPLFVWWGREVLRTSPTESVVWVKAANVLLIVNVYLTTAILLRRRFLSTDQDFAKALFFLFLLFSNGVVVWMTIRNIKEPLFLLTLMSTIDLIDALVMSERKSLTWWLSVTIVVVVGFSALHALKPLGEWFVPVYAATRLLLHSIYQGRLKTAWVLTAGLVSALIVFFAFSRSNPVLTLSIFRERFGSFDGSIVESMSLRLGQGWTFPIAVARFILGPGPINSFRQLLYRDAFVVSTPLGDLLICLGSVQWWLVLLMVSVMALTRPHSLWTRISKFMDVGVMALVVIGTYAYIYFGTGDTRHRAVVYVLSSAPLAAALLPSHFFGPRQYNVLADPPAAHVGFDQGGLA